MHQPDSHVCQAQKTAGSDMQFDQPALSAQDGRVWKGVWIDRGVLFQLFMLGSRQVACPVACL